MTENNPLHVPDLILEQYRLGELPREHADRVDRLSQTDEGLRRRIEALDRSDEEIARQYPPAWLAGAVRARLPRRSTVWAGRIPRRGLPVVMAAAAILLVFTLPRELFTRQGFFRPVAEATRPGRTGAGGPVAAPGAGAPGDAGADRIKGGPALAVYRRTAPGSETLADGNVAHPGDLLRVGYVSAGRAYGVILSIDGRGGVTLHLPQRGARAAELRRGSGCERASSVACPILLDQAYELDDAPGWERFYFVTGDAAFDVGPIVEAARRAAARDLRTPPASLALPRDLDQTMFSLLKP